ncbi:MAG: asparagine synthase (glutamine-hydrolyzing), partial [Arcticibacterium sp.]
MSDFFGIVSRKEVPVKEEWLGQMQKVLATWEPDYTNMLHRSDVGLGQNSLRITPESFFEFLPETLHGLSLVANARIDNREELLKQLDVPRAEVITDATIILYAYLKWGTRCPEKLIGEFAFAIWDENDKSLFCAKDALGIRPLYYHIGSDFVVIST